MVKFSNLPFEEEIIVPVDLPVLEVECACLYSAGSRQFQYVALINSFHPVAYHTISELHEKFQSLYPLHRVILKVVGS